MAIEAVELVVGALAAGAAAGVKESATAAVKDSYATLVESTRRLLRRDGREAASILEEHAANPESHRDELATALTEAGAGADTELLAAASKLLGELDPAGAQAGKYIVQVRDSKGVQIGDGYTMNLNF